MAEPSHYQQIKRATWVSALINTAMAVLKIVIGRIGHSQALIADGIHSLSDLLSDALVVLAGKAGRKSPDADHPYGHQRIETFATILLAVILGIAGLVIVYDTITAILHHQPVYQVNVWVIAVAAVSVIANEWLYHYLLKVARRIESNLLKSNAWHNRSDALVSLVVLASVVGTQYGIPYFDAVCAFLIAMLILKMAIKMAWDSIKELVDTGVEPDMLNAIVKVITDTQGVNSIHQLRTRSLGGNVFVDVHIIVDPTISVSEGHYIGERVHLNLVKKLKHVTDVTVHIDPEDDEENMPSIYLPNRSELEQLIELHCQELMHFNQIQKIQFHYLDGQIHLDLYFPLEFAAFELSQSYQDALTGLEEIQTIRVHFSS